MYSLESNRGSRTQSLALLYYINDMSEYIKSTMRLFADGTISYLAVTSQNNTLQNDLDKQATREEIWKMKFHPDKCQVLSVTKKKTPIKKNYIIHDHLLEHVTSAKYNEDLQYMLQIGTNTDL